MSDACSFCLNNTKNLYSVSKADYYYPLIKQILVEVEELNLSYENFQICCWCRAMFMKFVKFKEQVKNAFLWLYNSDNILNKEVISKPCLSLEVHQLPSIDYVEVCNLINEIASTDPFPKQEHSDVETFAADYDGYNEFDTKISLEDKEVLNLHEPEIKTEKIKKKTRDKKPKVKRKKNRKDKTKQTIRKSSRILVHDSDETYVESSDDNGKETENGPDLETERDAVILDINSDMLKKKDKVKTKSLLNGTKLISDKPQCGECGKMFSSKKTYKYHIKVLHQGENSYPCPLCEKVYQWQSNLARHIRSHKARESGELYCATCERGFSSVATYKQHFRLSRQHVAEKDYSFVCTECGKKFVSKPRLNEHMDWEHFNKLNYVCDQCHKPFKTRTSLYIHKQNVHADKETAQNLCQYCGKSYLNATKLKCHIVATHYRETPYACPHCQAAFGWYSSLYRHIREVHFMVKPNRTQNPRKPRKRNRVVVSPYDLSERPPAATEH